jgi:polyferredoxin
MKVRNARSAVQHLGFLVLMYGGRLGIRLGSAVPCFVCPFVPGCGGYCYLMGLQGYIGFGMSWGTVTGFGGLIALFWFGVFVFLVALFGKLWCGWVCPFGLIQDWMTALRRKLGVRERQIAPPLRRQLALIKYGLLVYIAAIPPLITMNLLSDSFYLPFCNICPGKSLLPLFAGETRYLALNFDNGVTLAFSLALLIITGIMLVGMFFKDRFFCVFCPLLALIHILKPITALKLFKAPEVCTGCGNCRRICPMDVEEVYRQRTSNDVQSDECLDCVRCAESCPADGAIGLRFLKFKLFLSSRAYTADLRKKS